MAIKVKPRGARALAAGAAEGGNTNALEVTVSDLSNALKRTVEDTFGHVRVRGEISGYRGPVASGHMYFSLKDDRSAIDAIVWKGVASKLNHRPEEGLEVIATGKLTTYPGRSKYQIVIDQIEPAGEGALMAQLERLRKKLTAEGLFAPERKQALPYMPRVIGVVTSPTGAVIRDILHRLADRFPTHVLVWPVRVQGETTPQEVARAVMGFNMLQPGGPIPRPDLLIVARGGGSLEDLWGFNDELVVRAAAASDIPLISAVGHETDTTLIDHASDHRAPTPTAAAEKAVPVRAELEAFVADQGARLAGITTRNLDARRTSLRAATRGLASPDMLLALPRRRFDDAASRLDRALERANDRARARYDRVADRLNSGGLQRTTSLQRERLDRAAERVTLATGRNLRTRRNAFDAASARLGIRPIERAAGDMRQRLERHAVRFDRLAPALTQPARKRVDAAERLLRSLSFKGVLDRGFALLRDADGTPVRSVSDLASGTAFQATLADGTLNATVDGEATARMKPKPRPERKQTAAPTNQGDLF